MADVDKVIIDRVIKGLDCHAKNKVCVNHCPYCDGTGSDESCTKQLATDALELFRKYKLTKRSKWTFDYTHDKARPRIVCPECKTQSTFRSSYCSVCGAYMREDGDGE